VSKVQVIVGGQFGSEGKGHCAAELAKREGEMLAIRTGGPNAGHTAWGLAQNGAGYAQHKLRQLPVASVVNSKAVCAISARSVVQLDLVERELEQTGLSAVYVDPAATLLEPAHIAVESGDLTLANWSTQKGIGAARKDRLHRTARTFRDRIQYDTRMKEVDVTDLTREYLVRGLTVQIEAAQGYGLGLHSEFYPKTTSADCRAIDALADAGVSPWEFPDTELEVWVVVRPYPIRVAGDSGPLLNETSWERLGLPEERTTVTNKVRRVGEWDRDLVRNAVEANGGASVKLWMNMADHIFPFLRNRTDFDPVDLRYRDVFNWVDTVWKQTGATIHALGTGPDTAIFLDA
jgi:adenylosuccinate synthase